MIINDYQNDYQNDYGLYDVSQLIGPIFFKQFSCYVFLLFSCSDTPLGVNLLSKIRYLRILFVSLCKAQFCCLFLCSRFFLGAYPLSVLIFSSII